MQKSGNDLLFDEKVRFLHIVKDGKEVNLTTDEIFDSRKYSEMQAVSYVASKQFFSKIVKRFSKVKFILGIAEGNYLNKFGTAIQNSIMDAIVPPELVEFWNESDE